MKSKLMSILAVLMVGLMLMLTGCSSDDTSADSGSGQQVTASSSSSSNVQNNKEKGTQEQSEAKDSKQKELKFRNKNLLDTHFEKHGKEMGFRSAKEYEKAAAAVVNNPKALHKKETDQDKNNTVYYVEKTNEFVVVSDDGFIRTYFNPSGGKKYYDKQ